MGGVKGGSWMQRFKQRHRKLTEFILNKRRLLHTERATLREVCKWKEAWDTQVPEVTAAASPADGGGWDGGGWQGGKEGNWLGRQAHLCWIWTFFWENELKIVT